MFCVVFIGKSYGIIETLRRKNLFCHFVFHLWNWSVYVFEKHDSLTLKRLGSTKRSYILKQTCSFQLHFCLSMCDLLADNTREKVNGLWKKMVQNFVINLYCYGTVTNSHHISINKFLGLYRLSIKISRIFMLTIFKYNPCYMHGL